MIKVQKRVGTTVATSTAGKKLIKEALGEEGYRGIKIMKKLVTSIDGKKKGKEVEEEIIRIGVKVILLVNNNDIKPEELKKHKNSLYRVCSIYAHCCTFAYEYSAESIQTHTTAFVEETSKTLSPYLTPKNVTAYHRLQTYITSSPILDHFYKSEDPEIKLLRKQWYDLAKRVMSILSTIS